VRGFFVSASNGFVAPASPLPMLLRQKNLVPSVPKGIKRLVPRSATSRRHYQHGPGPAPARRKALRSRRFFDCRQVNDGLRMTAKRQSVAAGFDQKTDGTATMELPQL